MRRTIVLAFFALTALPAVAQDAVARTFADWSVVCRSDGHCSATTATGDTGPDYTLTIGRHAEQSYWEIAFGSFATQADEWRDFVVGVDGASEIFALFDAVGAYGRESDFYFLGDGAQRVMDRMTPGSEVTVAFTDTAGMPQQTAFSLSGLTAALLWIDELQGRLGSERVAGTPPHGLVPVHSGMAAPDIPIALLDRHRADPDCEPLEELANGRDFVVDDLGDGYMLYMLPCQSGAYNFAQKVFLGSGGDDFDPQFFADYQAGIGWLGTPYMWNAGYDSATKSISTFAKARGIGDCGTIAHWQWNGYLFQLMEMRSRACTDDIDPEAEMPEFPVVYSAPLPVLQ